MQFAKAVVFCSLVVIQPALADAFPTVFAQAIRAIGAKSAVPLRLPTALPGKYEVKRAAGSRTADGYQ